MYEQKITQLSEEVDILRREKLSLERNLSSAY